jgi:hypothetical protein
MSLSSEGKQFIRFVPERKGLIALFETSSSTFSPSEGHRAAIDLEVELTEDHGVLTLPVRLPRYLMPEWGENEWASFIEGEEGFFYRTIDEAVVQCLSLALASDEELRKQVLQTANEVVIDFRGDLPNKYLAMQLGGYKVGVYRSGQGWPFWLSIQPTYDLAVKEAERIRDEAGLPKKSIVATGALLNALSVGYLPLIMSASTNRKSFLGWLLVLIAFILSGIVWFIRH